MSKTLATFTTPASGGPRSSAALLGNLNALQAFGNDHDASHWSFLLSAPKTVTTTAGAAELTGTATTGGSLTSSTTVRIRAGYGTPNGQTKASLEMAIALSGAQNAVSFTIPQPDTAYTPKMYFYVAISGATVGATCYQALAANMTVTGGTASVDTDGGVILNTAGTTTVLIKTYPPNTNPVHPTTNAAGSQDPLRNGYFPESESYTLVDDLTNTTVTRTVTTSDGSTLTEIGVYSDATRRLTTQEIKMKNLTIARYAYTYDATTGNLAAITPQEA